MIQSVMTELKNQIITKVAALDNVQKVYPAEELNPTGWPAVFVTISDMEGEFSSTAENSRVYSYECLVLFPDGQDYIPEDENNREDYAEQVVGGVVDSIINAIDTDFELDSLPTDTNVLFVNAANCLWGKYETEVGICKAAQVTLRVYTELTVT